MGGSLARRDSGSVIELRRAGGGGGRAGGAPGSAFGQEAAGWPGWDGEGPGRRVIASKEGGAGGAEWTFTAAQRGLVTAEGCLGGIPEA